ncbi:MAG: BamA/TamA family outer membrane protein [Prolixibacteraceae bacterium]|nr:BamA/TamA family outer membrane protein [Prolixibacteraceae bacterium]
MKNYNNILLISACLFLAACSGTRHLPEGAQLYEGAKINIESAEKFNKKAIQSTAESALRPQANKSYFGMRPKLWLYNATRGHSHSKLQKWMRKKGEAPVLMTQVKTGATSAIIDASLFNMGIFNSYTTAENIEKEHAAQVIYTSHVHPPYTIKALTYDIADDSINHLIQAEKEHTLIKIGTNYNLDILKNERTRINGILKNKGYFYFNPDYLLFMADTSVSDRSVTLHLTLKDSIPQSALTVYRINKVLINQNYSLNDRLGREAKDSVMIDGFIFPGSEANMKVKPKVITRSVYLRQGDVFSRSNYTTTLNRLMSMGYFKLVQISFSEHGDSSSGLLDATVLLTPMSKYSFRTELDLVSKSNNYAGPRLNVSLTNRNAFKGAELLKLNLAGTYESQLGRNIENLYTYSFNPQAELTFPSFLVPFPLKKTRSIYLPKTHFLLSYNFLKKISYFDMRTFEFAYGYRWKEDIRIEHELNPIDISFSSIRNQSIAFTELLESNPFLKKSYEEQFVAGGNYSFTFNEQMLQGKKVHLFFQLKSELAGNALALGSAIGGHPVATDDPAKVAGSIFSQFGRLSLESRVFVNLRSKNKLAMRVFAGAGKPYGNSSVLPYSKQFFSGGPSSIRAFQINSVGPGNYFQDTDVLGFLQMGGDVKLEMNAEYRFNIFSYFKGALFVDAGNVWLLPSNPAMTGTPFSWSGFPNQLAVGAGMGLRIDVSFFVLRFDLAMPLRKPWLEENHRWVSRQIDFGNSTWRKDNLLLNVAIGYPF